jgi:hypothetical protein
MELKHFKTSEFDSPDHPGSGINMKPEFLQRLDSARAIAGIPFKINSGFRTAAHNKSLKDKGHQQPILPYQVAAQENGLL